MDFPLPSTYGNGLGNSFYPMIDHSSPNHPSPTPRSKLEPEVQLLYESGGSGENSEAEMNGGANHRHPSTTHAQAPIPIYPNNHAAFANRNSHPPLNRTDINIAIDETYCVMENGQQKWKCNACPKFYTTKHNLVTHVLGHVGVRPYVCTICNKGFKQLAHLNAHRQTHEGNKSHQCPICKRSFLRLIYVKRHMITHVNRKPFMCTICPDGFVHPHELEHHMDKHKLLGTLVPIPVPMTVPDSYMNPHQMHQHATHSSSEDLNPKKQGDLRCEVCGRMFLYPSQLKDHMLSHAQVRPHRCDICGMRFIKDHHLKAHQITHTDERPHKCPICGRGFSLKGNMIRHTLIHQEERHFSCDICGKKFSQPQTLKMHMVVHADHKPFSCEICGKSLARAHNLRSHMALHRNIKPHQCTLCGSAFTMKGNLQRHFKEKHKDAYIAGQIAMISPPPTYETPPPVIGNALVHGQAMNGNNETVTNSSYDSDYPDDMDNPDGQKKRRKTPPKKLNRSPSKDEDKSQHDSQVSNKGYDGDNSCGPYDSEDSNAENRPRMKCHNSSSSPTVVTMSKYFSHDRCSDVGGSEELLGKIRALHTAIDDLAGKCAPPPEKVTAIHTAIDEMTGRTVYHNLACIPCPHHRLS